MHVACVAAADCRRVDPFLLLVTFEIRSAINKMNTTEYEPPATTLSNDSMLIIGLIYPRIRVLGVRTSDNAPVGEPSRCTYKYYVGIFDVKSHKDIGLELYMPMDCIMLRLIERDYDRRWYTIQLNTLRTENDSYEATREFIDTNRAIMEYMWRELPQPIAEELIHFFFW
jgi:hypothetical protein